MLDERSCPLPATMRIGSAGNFSYRSIRRRSATRLAACWGAIAIFACIVSGHRSPARAEGSWMTEGAMRAAFIGKTLDGHYADGEDWTESYGQDGRLDYRDRRRGSVVGHWYFRDHVFCTFYDPTRAID